jgi:hypothetical protein
MEPLQVKSANAQVKASREATCRKVLEYFQLQLSQLSLLCFIDEEDVEDMDFEREKNARLGITNRGFFVFNVEWTLNTGTPPLPFYVEERLRGTAGEILFKKLIYIHGSACEPEVSLVISLSHELQHYFQHMNYPQSHIADMSLQGSLKSWQEYPSEHDAMLKSKQVTSILCDEDVVRRYTNSRIELAKKNQQDWHVDQLRWEFIRDLQITDKYDFANEVAKLIDSHN